MVANDWHHPGMVIPSVLPEPPAVLTPFETGWPVRLADTDRDQYLRLDGVARYLQDVGYDHLEVLQDGDIHRLWVIRRTVIDAIKPISFGEWATLRRWPSATSTRWCTMRVQVCGSAGGLVETESFLIHFGTESGVPARMSDRFLAPMLACTTEHRLRWKAELVDPMPSAGEPGVQIRPFPLRATDIDLLDHMNNAVYLTALEEVLADHAELKSGPHRAVVEYGKPVRSGEAVELVSRRTDASLDVWFAVGADCRAVARVTPR